MLSNNNLSKYENLTVTEINKDYRAGIITEEQYLSLIKNRKVAFLCSLKIGLYQDKESNLYKIWIKDNKMDQEIYHLNNYKYNTTYNIKEKLKEEGFKYVDNGVWEKTLNTIDRKEAYMKLEYFQDKYDTCINLYETDFKHNTYWICGSCGCPVPSTYKHCNC